MLMPAVERTSVTLKAQAGSVIWTLAYPVDCQQRLEIGLYCKSCRKIHNLLASRELPPHQRGLHKEADLALYYGRLLVVRVAGRHNVVHSVHVGHRPK